jgi:hypothetical protein
VPINAVFFRHFRDGDRDYLTRTWLIDPRQPEKPGGKGGGKKKSEPCAAPEILWPALSGFERPKVR